MGVGIEAIKDAGFQGVCFDIELTKGDNIDIFSPQLYTSGVETEPEFAITQCGSTLDTERTCSYERLKYMKTKWVPSLSYAGHYPAVKKFFAEKGITTHGFIEWATPKGSGD